jgi:hypothetical protein
MIKSLNTLKILDVFFTFTNRIDCQEIYKVE